MTEKKVEYAQIFRALGDRHRIQILDMLMEREMNAGEILEAVDVVQSTLSHHMKSLCDSGLVTARRAGKWTYYSVSGEAVQEAYHFLERYFKENSGGAAEDAWEKMEDIFGDAQPEAKPETAGNKLKTKSEAAEKRTETKPEAAEKKANAKPEAAEKRPEARSENKAEESPETIYAVMKSGKKKKSGEGKKQEEGKKTEKDRGKKGKNSGDGKKEKKSGKKEKKLKEKK